MIHTSDDLLANTGKTEPVGNRGNRLWFETKIGKRLNASRQVIFTAANIKITGGQEMLTLQMLKKFLKINSDRRQVTVRLLNCVMPNYSIHQQ